jgi:hypothetical protein
MPAVATAQVPGGMTASLRSLRDRAQCVRHYVGRPSGAVVAPVVSFVTCLDLAVLASGESLVPHCVTVRTLAVAST